MALYHIYLKYLLIWSFEFSQKWIIWEMSFEFVEIAAKCDNVYIVDMTMELQVCSSINNMLPGYHECDRHVWVATTLKYLNIWQLNLTDW